MPNCKQLQANKWALLKRATIAEDAEECVHVLPQHYKMFPCYAASGKPCGCYKPLTQKPRCGGQEAQQQQRPRRRCLPAFEGPTFHLNQTYGLAYWYRRILRRYTA